MLTFGKNPLTSQAPSDPIDLFGDKGLPDEVECGENNEFWIKVHRPSKMMLFVRKVDGEIFKRVEIIQPGFRHIAASYGLGPRQIGAVRDALRLK